MKILKNPNVFLPLIIIALTFIIYQPILESEFVNIDDETIIIDNPIVNKGADVTFKEIWKKNRFNPHFKPLVYLSWNLEYRIWGRDPYHYHLHNLLLHLLNTILVFLIALRLFNILFQEKVKDKLYLYLFASIITIFFAIHPMHVESVAWATERKDVMYSFFFLSSLLSFLLYLEKKKIYWVIIALVLYFLTLLSKSMGITLFLFIILIDIYYHQSFSFKNLKYLLGFVALFIFGLYIYGIFKDFSRHAAGMTVGITNQISANYPENFEKLPAIISRLLIINTRFSLWFLHSIFPINSSLIYPRLQILEKLGNWIFLFPFINVSTILSLFFIRKKFGSLLFGFLFFTFSIIPAIAISDLGTSVFLSDRYLYLASIGVFIMLFSVLFKLSVKKRNNMWIYIPFLIFGVIFTRYSHKLVTIWKNSGTLWTHVISNYDNIPVAYSNRGRYYRHIGKPEKAMLDYNKGISLDKNYYLTYYNRAKLYYDKKKFDEAIKDYSTVIELLPDSYMAYDMRGVIYAIKKDTASARKDLEKAWKIKPFDIELLENMGHFYYEINMHQKSIDIYKKCLELEEKSDILNSVAASYIMLNDYENALKYFNKAIEIEPDNGTFLLNRSNVHFNLKDTASALEDAMKAMSFGVNVNEAYLQRLNYGN